MNDNDRDVEEVRQQIEREQIERERIADFAQEERNKEILRGMEAMLRRLRDAKPKERSELARRYAVAITEYEKSLAFFKFYVVDQA